ncbi:hypothetical protein [Streptomyces sp. WAC04114]|uniref:hypothetical protein n=1 Tax=Streptomyces sp. WAC04114 TaxID=2867961 RepID=UPI001C8BE96B|nr:hypothetical protein [Streptomyces sp. WAC04114]MBX9364377.1 hypothetical protein [Streptomyces sp. WAC04114]
MADASVVGLVGRVTGTLGPGLVGEMIVRVRGGAEHFLTMGGTGLGLARQLLASMDRGGQAPQGSASLNGHARKVRWTTSDPGGVLTGAASKVPP